MRYLSLILLIFIGSCQRNEDDLSSNLNCGEEDCVILNEFSFSVQAVDASIALFFGQRFIIDATVKVCGPDGLDFYISEDNFEFEKVVSLEPGETNLNWISNNELMVYVEHEDQYKFAIFKI